MDGPDEKDLYERFDMLAASVADDGLVADLLFELMGLVQEKIRNGHGLTVWAHDPDRAEHAQHIARRWLRDHGYLPVDRVGVRLADRVGKRATS